MFSYSQVTKDDLPSKLIKGGLNISLVEVIGSGSFGLVAKYTGTNNKIYAVKFESSKAPNKNLLTESILHKKLNEAQDGSILIPKYHYHGYQEHVYDQNASYTVLIMDFLADNVPEFNFDSL